MGTYIIRRLLLFPVTLLLLSVFFFFMLRTIPGDFVDYLFTQEGGSGSYQRITGQRGETVQQEYERIVRESYGLDKPVHVQYFRWVSHILRGDFGRSYSNEKRVIDVFKSRIPASVQLGLMGLVGSILIGIPLGILSARFPETWLDNILRMMAMTGLTVPHFVIAALILVFLSTTFHWIAPDFVFFWDNPSQNLINIAFPAAVLSVTAAAPLMRLTRSQMLEVLSNDYIRTARAKGLTERSIFYRHALRNAILPVVTVVGLSLDRLIAGSVIVEVVFGINGMGAALVRAASARDFPIIQMFTLVIGSVIILVNLIVDITYGWIDPRVRYE